MEGLRLRKLADTTAGERVAVTHPISGERNLYTPEDAARLRQRLAEAFEGIEPSPYPFLGLRFDNEDGAPEHTTVGPRVIEAGRAEGWITTSPAEGELVVRSTGPRQNPFGPPPHAFMHYETITFHTVDGDYVYNVVENPDKWPDEKDGKAGFGGEVRHYYELQLSGVHAAETDDPAAREEAATLESPAGGTG